MNRKRSAWLLLMPLLAACADGGSRGTGVSTAQGNVDSVQMSSAPKPRPGAARALLARWLAIWPLPGSAVAGSEVEGIRITVEGTGLTTATDADGRFSLRGLFEGDQVLLFERPEDDLPARLPINIPAGGTLTLNDVAIDASHGAAAAASQGVAFEGVIVSVDCGGQTLALISSQRSPGDTDAYVVDLATSSLRDARGDPVACDALERGEPLRVQGFVEADGSFGEGTVVTED